jgi:hypothetical protein
MRGCVWAALLRRIPPEQHNILMLVTRCRIEIAIQNILRIDDEFLAFKGRLAGSQDAGRLYFIPLDNIDYFGFNRPVKDEEFVELFGDFQSPPEVVAAPPVAQEPQLEESNLDTQQGEAPPQPETPPNAPVKPSLAIKSAVLERFRARSTGPTMLGQKPPAEST